MPKQNTEVERKWDLSTCKRSYLITGIFEDCSVLQIFQYYVRSDDKGEVRLRQQIKMPSGKGTYTITLKDKGEMSRMEKEDRISIELFEGMKPISKGQVVKNRRVIKGRNHNKWNVVFKEMALDEYLERHYGLRILEVEFDSDDDAQRFVLPAWAEGATEVTKDKAYKNASLALKGLPAPPPVV